jgi:hypothetical protein
MVRFSRRPVSAIVAPTAALWRPAHCSIQATERTLGGRPAEASSVTALAATKQAARDAAIARREGEVRGRRLAS